MCLFNIVLGVSIASLLLWNWKQKRDSVFLWALPFFMLPPLNCLTVEFTIGVWFFLVQALVGMLATMPIKRMRLTWVTIGLSLAMLMLVILNSLCALASLAGFTDWSHYSAIASVIWMAIVAILILGGVLGDGVVWVDSDSSDGNLSDSPTFMGGGQHSDIITQTKGKEV